HISKVAKSEQQLAFGGKDLQAGEHGIRHPDVAVDVDSDTLGTGEVAGAVSVLAEAADEVPVSVEDFDAVIQGVGDEEVSVLIDGGVGRFGKLAGIGQGVVLARGSNLAYDVARVSVEHNHLVKVGIHHVQVPVLQIDGDAARAAEHVIAEAANVLVGGVELLDHMQSVVADKEMIGVVDGNSEDRLEMSFRAVPDELNIVIFGIEDEHRSHPGVGDIEHSFGIDGYAIRSVESEAHLG